MQSPLWAGPVALDTPPKRTDLGDLPNQPEFWIRGARARSSRDGRRQGEGFPVPGFRMGSGQSSERRSRAPGACQTRIRHRETRGRPPLRWLGAFMKSQLWKGLTGTGPCSGGETATFCGPLIRNRGLAQATGMAIKFLSTARLRPHLPPMPCFTKRNTTPPPEGRGGLDDRRGALTMAPSRGEEA